MIPGLRGILFAPLAGAVAVSLGWFALVDNDAEILYVYAPVMAFVSYLAMGLVFYPIFKRLQTRRRDGLAIILPLAVIAQIFMLLMVWILFAMGMGAMPWQAIADLFDGWIGSGIRDIGLITGSGMGIISGFVFWLFVRQKPAN